MNYNELARFEYNGKTYVYYTLPDKPKNLLYGYLENDEIKPVIDLDEAFIMQEAYKKAFISTNPANHIKLTTTKHNGKLFQIMFDKVSGLKFFYEVYNGKYYRAKEEDAIELFNIFNKFERYEEAKTPKKSNKMKALNIVFGIITSLQMAVCLMFVGKMVYDEYILPNYPLSQFVQVVNDIRAFSVNDFSVEKIEEAVNDNTNLTEEERAFFLEEIPYLVKYQEYVDMDSLLFRLRTTDVKYHSYGNPECSGSYHPYGNFEDIYECTGFEDAPKSVLRHEVRHNFSGATTYSFSSGIYEATTEIIAYEYGYHNYYSYFENVCYQKVLYEIIGSEPFAAFEESNDITYIVKPLVKLIPDEQLATELISSLDNIIVYNSEKQGYYNPNTNSYENNTKVAEIDENLRDCHNNIQSILGRYFYAAKGYHMDCDVVCIELLNQLCPYTGATPREIYVSIDGGITGIHVSGGGGPKGFFLDKYIAEHPNYVLELSGLGYYEIGLDSENNPICLTVPNKMELQLAPGVNRLVPKGENLLVVNPEDCHSKEIVFGSGLEKGFTEVLQEEWNYKPEFCNYKEQATYVRILCELIGTEPFEKYLETGSLNSIIDALYEINGDWEQARRLIGNIDVTKVYYELLVNTNEPADCKEDEMIGNYDENLTKARGEIYTSFFIYFDKKDPINRINGNVIVNTYYRQLTSEFSFESSGHVWPVEFVTSDGEFIAPDSYESVSVVKAYFNPDLKDVVPQPYLEVKFEGDTLNSRFVIDENGEPATKPTTEIIFIDENNTNMARISGDNNSSAYCQYIEARDKKLS